MSDLGLTRLDDHSVIDVRGPDAFAFLQGQVSQDMERIVQDGSGLAGLHNPQGRCLAVLRILCVARDHYLIVLPGELAETIRALLARYVLRAKVTVTDAGATWRVYGATGPDAAAAASTRVSMPMDPSQGRFLIVAPRSEPLPDGEPAARVDWRLDDIAAGLPELHTATSGQFVAQMLNLDLIEGISFKKGCYTGQEVIARAHYRGQVKRRMQRFGTASDALLLPGARVLLGDGRTAQVVMSALLDAGGQEFLAVTTVAPVAGTSAAAEATAGTEGNAPPEVAPLDCAQLPLPYELPAA